MRLTRHSQSTRRYRLGALAVACTAAAVLGWSGQVAAQGIAPPDAVAPPDTELKGLADKMQQRLAATPYTENQDYNYAILMRSLLEDEVRMAENQMTYGTDTTVRNVAKEIAASREKEIEKLSRWIDQFQKYN